MGADRCDGPGSSTASANLFYASILLLFLSAITNASLNETNITPSPYGPEFIPLDELGGLVGTQDQPFVDVPYSDELLPDYSNLVVQIIGPDGEAETINRTIVSIGESFALIHLERLPGEGELLGFFAEMVEENEGPEVPGEPEDTDIGAEETALDVPEPDEFIEIDNYIGEGMAAPSGGWGGLFQDHSGKSIAAEVEFKGRVQKLTYDTQLEGQPKIPKGRYDITLRPRNHPIEELVIEDFDLAREEHLLDLDEPPPGSVDAPFGVRFDELYVLNPRADIRGTFKAKAKGSRIYKCAEWDFQARFCRGDWVNILNVTPGGYYTIDFDSADPAYGEGSDYFTLTTITIDGDMSDWDAVLSNPNNIISDGVSGIDDLDVGQTADRDLVLYAFTWDDNYFYSYFKRTAGGTRQSQLLFYVDRDNSGYLNATDYVFFFNWDNTHAYDSSRYPYVPVNSSGDNITGDGVDEPGTVGSPTSLETAVPGGDTSGIYIETRLNWSHIGIAPGAPFLFHVSIARGAGTGLPGQVEDNLAPGSTLITDVDVFPDNVGTTQNNNFIYYNHTVTNLGNSNDTVNINTSGSNPGYVITLTYVNGTPLTDTNSDGLVDVGVLDPDQSVNITVGIQPKFASQGDMDHTYVSAISSNNPAATDSALDTTYVGDLIVYPDNTGYYSINNTVIKFNHTVTSNLANKVININATSNNSWTVNVTYLNGTYVTDTNNDSILDLGELASGESIGIYVRIAIPYTAVIGTVDRTTVLVWEDNTPSTNSTVYDLTTIARPLEIFPNRSGYISVTGSIFYDHTVRNAQNFTDVADISNRSSQNWFVRYYDADRITHLTDTNGNGVPDTGNLSAFGGSRVISIKLTVNPPLVPEGTNDLTNITVNSSNNPAIWSRVTDNTTAFILITYKDASHSIQSQLFNKNQTVYAKGSGLGAYNNVYFLWYDSNGTLRRTSPDIPVDANDEAADELHLNYSLPSGTYTVRLYNAQNNAEIAVTTFQVFGVPNVTVVSPNGGELWNLNRTIFYNVTDDSGKNVTVTIQYSTNGGIGWNNITTLALNATNCTYTPSMQCVEGQFNYTWDTKTGPDSTNYQIRVLASNSYFTGSDFSDAVFTVDNTPPAVVLNAPPANVTAIDGTIADVTFNCSATDAIGLSNISLYLTDGNNQSFSINRSHAINGQDNSSVWNVTLGAGIYTWNCLAKDKLNNTGWGLSNRTIIVNQIHFTPPTPVNGSDVTDYGLVFNISSLVPFSPAGNYIEIDGTNHSCVVSVDNYSCSYTLSYPEHLFNHTYSLVGFGNVIGEVFVSNETRLLAYYGCGYVNTGGALIADVSINGSTCFTLNSSSVTLGCLGYSVTGDDSTGTHGINITDDEDVTVADCIVSGFSTGIYLQNGSCTNLTGNIAFENAFGFDVFSSMNVSLYSNNATNNSAGGLVLGAGADNATLYSNYLCFNDRNDLNNSGLWNIGGFDRCDYSSGWMENGYQGCTYTCSLVWHRFFGNVSGTMLLSPRDDDTEIFYSWMWDGQKGKVYVVNADAAISWMALVALGRDTSIGPSSGDFTELDSVLGSGGYHDSIENLYSSDGSIPLETRNITVYKNPVDHTPLANSSTQGYFKTGIAWDSSQTIGDSEFDIVDNEDVVFICEINGTAPYHYDIRVPGTLDSYKGGSGLVEFWVELE